MTRRDPVSPDLAAYILDRDRGCVVQRIAPRLVREIGPCRDRSGRELSTLDGLIVRRSDADRVLTVAHVRDRLGGKMGQRPPATRRRLAAVCAGHHLLDPIVDRADVRPVVDEYLEEQEGPDHADARPWEEIPRVRGGANRGA